MCSSHLTGLSKPQLGPVFIVHEGNRKRNSVYLCNLSCGDKSLYKYTCTSKFDIDNAWCISSFIGIAVFSLYKS